jgi:hypothetical protein
VGAAVARVLAVATVDPVGKAVAMEAVVASIAEQCVVAACTAWVGGTMVADDLGIVPLAPSDLVVAALTTPELMFRALLTKDGAQRLELART